MLVSGCAMKVDKNIYWHSVGKEKSIICKDKETAATMVRFGYSERARFGQALKIRNMYKSNDCLVVNTKDIYNTGVIYKFPIAIEFPESFRGIKKEIKEITYNNNNNYWLIETKK